MQTTKKIIPVILGLAVLALPLLASAADLDPATQEALIDALNDERRSEATYQAAIDELGEVMPFIHIVRAEQRHQQELLMLFDLYGVEVPPNPWEDRAVEVPATRQEACEEGMQSEKDNVALYDQWLENVTEPDVRTTFERLRSMSQDHHLRAFTRCASGGGMGMGKGMGKGHGKGMGQGMQGMHGGQCDCPCCVKAKDSIETGP